MKFLKTTYCKSYQTSWCMLPSLIIQSISGKNAGTKLNMGCWMSALHANLPCDDGNNVNEAPGLSFISDMKILCVQTFLESFM